jgi:SWI/SNF-related matrix-associated actin-dependent regulator of chromatin subfamily A-like protein 1
MGRLIFENHKFLFKPSPVHLTDLKMSERDLAKQAGLKFDSDSLQWWTRNFDKALKLRRFADESAEQKLKNHFITHFAPPECIVYPDHLTPKPYQLDSALHCLTRSPAYCADEAGLGKTVTSVLCMNSVQGKTLIICPTFLKYNWQREIETWSTRRHRRIEGQDISLIEDGKAVSADINWQADIVILPDSLLTNTLTRTMIMHYKWTWLFVDEVHRYKSEEAKRTGALLETTNPFERIVLLSGTPIPNGRPIELYPLLSGVAPEAILHRELQEYRQIFCDPKPVTHYERGKPVLHWSFNGASNLKTLKKELKSKLMIRHLKKSVLKELGPKTRKIIFLDQPARLRELEKSVLQNFSWEELVGEEHTAGDIATYRRQVGESKIEPALEIIKDLLSNSSEKLVVFVHHISVVEQIYSSLRKYNPLIIRGGMSARDKADQVKKFQVDQKHQVVVGNIDSCGIGNTLTAANRAIFVEYSWVPGVNEQAEDRLHRITQSQNVYIQYLVLRNSLDEKVLHAVLAKQEKITQVMN